MASSSSSSITPKVEYEVFLGFRGEDTRCNFTSHLYEALRRENIKTFIDDKLNRGEGISSSLLKAIEHSKISVIIFSKDYASSRWCLKELEEILKCKKAYDQIVMPVFYDVDPSDVRNQTGDFGKAFAELEKRFMDDSEMLQRWRTALRDAANLSGYDSKNYRNDAALVEDIVNDVCKKLDYNSSFISSEDPIGLESSIGEIENLLCTEGVRKLGIWGIGGIGKTTLVDAIFKKISKQFEESYFIRNIREESEKSGGLNALCQRLSYAFLGDIHPNHEFTFRRKNFINGKKVLIVFDDVTKFEQIKCLMEVFDNLDSESQIIITTRDKHVLTNYKVDHIHEMPKLSSHNSLKLFARHAFKGNPPTEDYRELLSRVVDYARGVPLALKVLGSFLFERTKREWESAIKNLTSINAHEDIQKVLKISYDGLHDTEKEIFLDIACFFKGCKRDLLEATLDAHDLDCHIHINVLIERCLITTSNDSITMHHLLEEMGREIVRQESINDIGKRSRLWNHEDIFSVLKYNTGTRAIRSIRLDLSKVAELHLNPEAFKNMQNLNFLEFYRSEPKKKVTEFDFSVGCLNCRFWKKNSSNAGKKVHGFEKLKFDFPALRYFSWDGYPAKSLPPNFNPKNLATLCMYNSKVKRLWTDNQKLDNLKYIDLSHSKHLRRIPDLSLMPNLEHLILEDCTNLLESFSSIHFLHKLVILNLQGCKGFDNLPISVRCKSLREVNLSNCSNLKTIEHLPDAVEELYLDGTAIKEFPSIGHLFRLVKLSLRKCSRLERLPDSFHEFKSLKCLYLSDCSKLDRLPNVMGNLETLDILELEEIYFCRNTKMYSQLKHMEAKEIDFINGFKLKLDVRDAFRNIERNPDVWYPHEVNSLPTPYICYPGSKIPKWFGLKSMTSFIEFPEGWFNDNLIGFALCAIISLQEYQQLQIFEVGVSLIVNGEIISSGHLFETKRYKPEVIQSDRVFVGYNYSINSVELLTLNLNSQSGFVFFVDHATKNDRSESKVKECGVTLLYAKDDDLRRDGRVDRDKRLNFLNCSINDCLKCCLDCCRNHHINGHLSH